MNEYQQKCKQLIEIDSKVYNFYNPRLLNQFGYSTKYLPFSILILMEQIIRNQDDKKFKVRDINRIIKWSSDKKFDEEIPFMPSRVVMQDFTGVPSIVDLASLRQALKSRDIDPQLINPQIPVDLIIDHSIQVDRFGSNQALEYNNDMEFYRNSERYKFLKWGQNSFKNLRIFPPGAGIIHQINLEYLSQLTHEKNDYIYPDTLVGTDSHSTMINSLGVLGWGVGGIEAESAMLNQPIFMKIPEVVGFKLTGAPNKGVTATDIVLTITEMLRKKGVVEKFVEFYGTGLDSVSLADRATISNMAPEYGATVGFFPVDDTTIEYLHKTGRSKNNINRSEAFYKATGLFRDSSTEDPKFSDSLQLDLSDVVPSIAGPKRPQDRITLKDSKKAWHESLTNDVQQRGYNIDPSKINQEFSVKNKPYKLKHGSILIAAITSCTNTSNPSLLVCAGLLAEKAIMLGLKTKSWVKTSLAPGSRVVTDYLKISNLDQSLQELGFYTVGYGCTTCIGNSGPIDTDIVEAIRSKNIVCCSILSGNRNFEGRIHVDIKANFLASPPLVVAYALVGSINIDFNKEAIGKSKEGKDIYLKDIWPTSSEIKEITNKISPELYQKRYSTIFNICKQWDELDGKSEKIYDWDSKSTYIQNPPFFNDLPLTPKPITEIKNARALLKLGDSVTTDHISPAGSFSKISPAGKYLENNGVAVTDFNTYGARRGNDRIMVRGTFANIRIRNQLAPGTEGGFTKLLPDNKIMSVFDAANEYKKRSTPCIVIAGLEYGTGSSRDWAAKGPYLLGVKAVVAKSYERIHRSNLIGMGIIPLQFLQGQSAESYNLTGEEEFSVLKLNDNLKPGAKLILKADNKEIPVLSRIDTEIEIEYYRNGGILHTVLLEIIEKNKAS